ncbi:MAG: gamma carbonic anhydrase family protein [Bacteroidota bacterium]
MATILPIQGVYPQIPDSCFLTDNATLVGDLVVGEFCSFWFQTVVRGDVNEIRIGDHTNIQDGAVIHCTYQKAATKIGSRVSIGHKAIIHGCTIEDEVLIGMGAIVMDHAVVEKHAIVAAGAVVPEGTRAKSGMIYAGIPARPIKEVSPEQIAMILRTSENYIKYASWYT